MPVPPGSEPTTMPGMDQADPLAQLRDIHLPEPVSWWPLAPGWWVLALLLLLMLFFTVRWLLTLRRHNAYRGEAQKQLAIINAETGNNLQQCQALMGLLRRTAKTAYPGKFLESELNPLFLNRLNACCAQPVFSEHLRQQLGELPYQANPDIADTTLEQLQQGTARWLKKHRRGHHADL
jgi:hypothetical protein